ncbi:bifunctional riboflavin kinase/FAD synthetase [Pseudoramibacter sp.]|jgi:riboflavin kinase/FMN adenylyltransferase|uniref:bifunctional riboflavin kinase/FAD synthetase n=1 Tax=Pseudoramibacter sp. TaxID=2034862 RepID=UPI0025F2D92F|nr:bifunctional riboflavin kinase/FAD synthetase [Pseudoramibacter sp.]MCH4072825.1 bifunctional riboflavin kinase/FAD synthetase [Pseudoramibacter sp.]MCH4106596.1 bifunctional riboflavin kinase/FAD synthetase [Pseudoramibacter sp.]
MKNANKSQGIVMALGFFDGVHKGHQALLKKTLEVSNEENLESSVMTFKKHPLNLIFPSYAPDLITTNDEKINLIRSFGIQHVYLNDFNERLMNLSSENFIRDYLLKKYNLKHLVVGFNYTFGYKGAGTVETLKKYGKKYHIGISVVPPCIIDGEPVSSTRIRELIKSGKVDEVEPLLGRYYQVKGSIVKGKGLGHQFGVPTANLKLKNKVILPSPGVYYTSIILHNRTFDGLTNLGSNPTFKQHPYSIETYIYDFDEDIYNQTMVIIFKKKIRDEIKFDSVNDLMDRIKSDINYIDKIYHKS